MFDPREVKTKCNGMLPVAAYAKLYDTALKSPEGSFIEVGAAHAAATVCLARALKDRGTPGKVYSFEKIVGGSREHFGNVEANMQIIRRNLAFFSVDDRVEMIFGDVKTHHDQLPENATFGMLVIDADGRIDREFRLFYDRLLPGSHVVIDDARDVVRVKRLGRSGMGQRVFVDQKHRLTFQLLSLFQNRGLVTGENLEDTWFGTKKDQTFGSITEAEIIDVYQSLVFANALYSPTYDTLTSTLKAVAPAGLYDWLRIQNRRRSGDFVAAGR
jgi:hypothetical protein